MSDLSSISGLLSSRSSAPVRAGDDAATTAVRNAELKPSPRVGGGGGVDSVELSARARLIASLSEISAGDEPIRSELVERVKSQIADGTYDTPEKLAAAAWNLSRRLDTDA